MDAREFLSKIQLFADAPNEARLTFLAKESASRL
jgi:hypothetical protein